MAEVFAHVRQERFEEKNSPYKSPDDYYGDLAVSVAVEWVRLRLVDTDRASIGNPVHEELIKYAQALNTMHAMLREDHDRVAKKGDADAFCRVALDAGLFEAEKVLDPDERMREYTRRALPNAFACSPAIAKMQLLVPDDTEEEVDEGGEIGDSDEESSSGSGSGSGSGSDDDIRSESEEHDDPSEDEDDDEPAKKQKCDA